MSFAASDLLRRWASLVVVLSMVPWVHAAGWFDNFDDGNAEDGNPLTWTYNEVGATPGIYDASSGDYSLSAPGGGDDNNLLASVDMSFEDSYVRTRAFVQAGSLPEEVGGNVGVLARWDPSTLSGYALILDDGSQYALLRVDGGTPVVLAGQSGIGVDAATDVMIELEIVGDQLSAFFWRPDEPKPIDALAITLDNTYASGRGGIIYNEDDDNTAGVFRFAAAQDMPFVDALAGDYNNNGTVDAADYVLWRGGGPLMNETVTIGSVTPEDYTEWRANFGATEAGGALTASSVPEPTTAAMLVVAAFAMLPWRGWT